MIAFTFNSSNNGQESAPKLQNDERKASPGYEPHEIQQIVEAAEHFEAENHVYKFLPQNIIIILIYVF